MTRPSAQVERIIAECAINGGNTTIVTGRGLPITFHTIRYLTRELGATVEPVGAIVGAGKVQHWTVTIPAKN